MPAIETIKLRRGTAAAWTAANPILATGEPGYESDTGNLKIGDGTTAWTALPYRIDTGAYVGVAGSQSMTGGAGWPGALTISDGVFTPESAYGEPLGPYVLAVTTLQNPPNPPAAADGSGNIPIISVARLEGTPANTSNGRLFADALLVRIDLDAYNDSAITKAYATGIETDVALSGTLNAQNVTGDYVAPILYPTASGTITNLFLVESDSIQGAAAASGLTITNFHGGHFARPVVSTNTVASCSLTSGSNQVTVTSGGFPLVAVGMTVTDIHGTTNIPAGTTVSAISGNTLTLSANATGSLTESLNFSPNVTVTNALSLWADVGQLFKTNGGSLDPNQLFTINDTNSGQRKSLRVTGNGTLEFYNNAATAPPLMALTDGGGLIWGHPLRPSGVHFETVPRASMTGGSAALTSGALMMVAIELPGNFPVSNIGFASTSSGGATSPTHWWFGLFDSNLNGLAFSADQTTAAWGAGGYKSLAIASAWNGSSYAAASSYTTPSHGTYYLGVMMAASTPVTIMGANLGSNTMASQSPVLEGTSTTGLTTPPSGSSQFTAAALTAGTVYPYATV